MTSPRPKRRFWRLVRIYFRRFRITVLLVILGLVGFYVYVNQIGLPDFVKNPLLQKLRERGVELQFSRLRLHLFHGLVAENVRFGRTNDVFSPRFTMSEAQVLLNHRALIKFQLQVDALSLRKGRLVWPIRETHRPPRYLVMDHIETDLRLLPNDQWRLDNFEAAFAGGNIRLTGNITNASALREWSLFQPKGPRSPPGEVQNRLRRLADALERIEFSTPPELILDVQGDARDPQSFLLRLQIDARGSRTPWGTFTNGTFVARLHPASSNGVSEAELQLEASEAKTEWATTSNLQLSMRLVSLPNPTNLVSGNLVVIARSAETKWGSLSNAQFSAEWIHAFTNPIPISGQGRLECATVETKWASGHNLNLTARLTDPNTTTNGKPIKLTGWWTNLEPHLLAWDCRVSQVKSEKIEIDKIAMNGSWRSPNLTLTIPQAALYEAELAATCALDVNTRKLTGKVASDVDPHKIEPLLTPGAQRWLRQFSWSKAPEVAADIALTLPAWTNRQPNWRAEVQPTLRLAGQFKIEDGGAYLNLPISSARSHFTYSNMWWTLPDLTVTRPEGGLDVYHRADDRSKNFYWKIRSSIDLRSLRPLLETNVQKGLDYFSFSGPPTINAEIWGRWRAHERIGFAAQVLLTNFSFRGQTADTLQTSIYYSNRWLLFTNCQASAGGQRLSAASLTVDLDGKKIYLTNGFSTADPRMVTRAIGPMVDKVIEPYRFANPPVATVEGVIPLKNVEDADLHFHVEGGPFNWKSFNLNWVSGEAHWKGQRLNLRRLRGEFYGGTAAGSANFDFKPKNQSGTMFQFDLATTNTHLKSLVTDISGRTNNLEGFLSGHLVINSANTEDWASWQGGGDIELRDGLIWDIPIFGIFSPVLNGIVPGWGNSRASGGTGTFTIANSVIGSEDLQIRTTGTRLQYRGRVDFHGRVEARVEAELLRDVWGVGPIISTVFGPVSRLFEYKLTGTLAEPKTEPVFFVPKVVLMPFRPFRSFRELFPPTPPGAGTNAPPTLVR